MTNIKLTTGFPTSYRWSAYVTPKSSKGWLKSEFVFFELKSTADRLRRCQLSSPVNVKHLMVGGNVDHTQRRDLYLAVRPSRTNSLITI